MTFAQKMFSFEGRMGRQDFWICTLIIWAANIVLFIALLSLGWSALMTFGSRAEELDAAKDPTAVLNMIGPLLPLFAVYCLFELATIWPSLAICAKRLHDRDQSALWLLLYAGVVIANIIPFLGIFFGLGVRVWWLVNLGILEGVRGPNRYGESPDPQFGAAAAFA